MTSQLAPKIFLLLLCSCASPALSVDRIYQSGPFLNSSQTLLSNDGNFTLGFQRIGTDQSNASYLGIWFNGGRNKVRPFWLANRNNPIPDDSGALAIDSSGNFKLTSSAAHVLTLYSSRSSTTNLTAVLQDSGNLILKEADSPGDKFLWQSFDFPTNTLLPGMKLGINHRTGKTWSLNSWLSDSVPSSLNSRPTVSVPSSGTFRLEWDHTEQQLVVKRRETDFWTSGPLTSKFFQEMKGPYSFINVSNADEDYFMFTVAPYFDPNNISAWVLYNDGSIADLRSYWFLFYPSICDGNNAKDGCKKWEGPECRNDGDKFVRRFCYFDAAQLRNDDNSSLSKSDCKEMCWKDCQCVAVLREYHPNNTGCMLAYGNIKSDPTGRLNMPYDVIVQESTPKRYWIWISIVVALVVIAALGTILFYLRNKRIREKLLQDLLAMDDTTTDLQEFQNDGNNGHNLTLFSVGEIMTATDSFSLENKLGQGGFGPVYKGKFPEGREIAVKRLSRSSGQGLVEFKNELILIAKLQHRNLVRLLGFSIHGEEKMLVYEFMPNSSLDSFIFDSSKSGLIDWKARFQIIDGIAQGMLYLHKYSRLRIIHRDLKASNILLDQDLTPKISDFGMARIFQVNQIESNTNRIVGTYGYMSPEYAMEGVFSVKSDVFSFGVLLLEIVSGRKNRGFLQMDRPLNLISYAWELWREGNPLELVDPTIRESLYSKEKVLRCIKLGLLCVENNPSDRPTMSDVVTMLGSEAAQLPEPKQPAFSNAISILDVNSNLVKQETDSTNTCSFSTMEAR